MQLHEKYHIISIDTLFNILTVFQCLNNTLIKTFDHHHLIII